MKPKPGPFVNEIKDSTLFYGNRVIKEFKEKYSISHTHILVAHSVIGRDSKHVEWVRAYIAILEGMHDYVMEFHTTGLVWNPKVCTTRFQTAYS
jgi:adenylyl cyclase-associated protein